MLARTAAAESLTDESGSVALAVELVSMPGRGKRLGNRPQRRRRVAAQRSDRIVGRCPPKDDECVGAVPRISIGWILIRYLSLPPGASGAHPRLRSYPWNLIRLIPAKGVRRPRAFAPALRLRRPTLGATAMATRTARPRPTARPCPSRRPPAATRTLPQLDQDLPGRTPWRARAGARDRAGGGEPALRVYDATGPQGHDVVTDYRPCAARGSRPAP